VFGEAQRQQRQPRPLQQRLHEPFGGGIGHLARIRRHPVEPMSAQHVDGGGDRARLEADVGVDECQDLSAGGRGQLAASVRLAQPARRGRGTADHAHAGG